MQVFSADGPSVLEIDTSPSSGLGEIGTVVTLKLAMSEVTTVAGGTPTLTLNDGGTATYVSGSGTDALTFSYTAAAGQNTAALEATALNLNGATIDGQRRQRRQPVADRPRSDRPANRYGAAGCHGGGGFSHERHSRAWRHDNADAQHERGGDGQHQRRHADADAQRWRCGDLHRRLGHRCADLQLHGRVRADTSSLAATAVNLNGATVTNANGSANLSLSGLTQSGPQVDGTPTLAIDGNGFSGS